MKSSYPEYNQILIEKLQRICDELRSDITLIANFYEGFDVYDKSVEDENIEQKQKEHKKLCQLKYIEYLIIKSVKEEFSTFINEHQLNPKQLNPDQCKDFISIAINSARKISSKLVRVSELFGSRFSFDEEQIQQFIKKNLDHEAINRLCKGQEIFSFSEDFMLRFKVTDELLEHREIASKQFLLNNNIALNSKMAAEDLEHSALLWEGIYFSNNSCRTNFCGEFTGKSLKKMMDDSDIFFEARVVRILVSFFDDNNQPDDNHSFFGINVHPKAKLDDFSSWDGNDGNEDKKAIIFDPWNGLVCFASDYTLLPRKYKSFHGGKWEGTEFNSRDVSLYRLLYDTHQYYHLTGMSSFTDRYPILLEEYQLSPIETFPSVRKFVESLLSDILPEHFHNKVDFYLTSIGTELVRSLPGFEKPSIGIHKEFLLGLNRNEYTSEEFKFALSSVLHEIKEVGIGLKSARHNLSQGLIDITAVTRCGNGPAACSYLQKCIPFSQKNSDSKFDLNLNVDLSTLQKVIPAYPHRIKELKTNLAKLPKYITQNTNVTPAIFKEITDVFPEEIKDIQSVLPFEQDFNSYTSNEEKLLFLKSLLPDLQVEIFPYEHTLKPSLRVQRFCNLLSSIKIDNNSQEIQLVDDLINEAFRLRISAFDLIYKSINFPQLNLRSQKKAPLGIFKHFQSIITKFTLATSYEEGLLLARQITEFLQEHKHHFHRKGVKSIANGYVKQFRENNNGLFPKRHERFFGSQLGHEIDWTGFEVLTPKTINGELIQPWHEHISWAKQDQSGTMLNMLLELGLIMDKRLWDLMDLNYAYQLPSKFIFKSPSSLPYPDFDKTYFEIVLAYFSKIADTKKIIRNQDESFDDYFKRYFDERYNGLVLPGQGGMNLDNPSVQELFEAFVEIVQHGTPSEKEVVRSFFLGREDKRDLFNLIYFSANETRLDFNSLYIQFFVKQQFRDQRFDLFSTDEIFNLIEKIHFDHFSIPVETYLEIFKLQPRSFTYENCQFLLKKSAEYSILGERSGEIVFRYCTSKIISIFAKEALQIILLTNEYVENIQDKQLIFSLIDCSGLTPENPQIEQISLNDLIIIYRSFDANCIFSHPSHKELLERIIYGKIEKITDLREQQKQIEALIFTSPIFSSHIQNLLFKRNLIQLWVKAVFNQVGKDDGSKKYFDQIFALALAHCFEQLDTQSLRELFNLLTIAVQSQHILSEFIGSHIAAEKYQIEDKRHHYNQNLTYLAWVSQFCSSFHEAREKFIAFLSAPLDSNSLDSLITYLLTKNLSKFLLIKEWDFINIDQKRLLLEQQLRNLHLTFWELRIEERAVVIDHILIPAEACTNDHSYNEAYQSAFEFVTNKLFPENTDENSDDNFIVAVLRSYLETASRYERPLLLAALLVVSNEAQTHHGKLSAGKKLALLCEHMGPAYIKLAQAIHSHPLTPEYIKKDLEHVKGHANPPPRWDLWRMIDEVLPADLKHSLIRVGDLLGSASYNLALEASLKDQGDVVLLMLRENAKQDAQKGFDHLQATIVHCQHPKMLQIKDALLSMLAEAQELSKTEMDTELSKKQNEIAEQIYPKLFHGMVDNKTYEIEIETSKIICNGVGYRIITRMYGEEFNDLKKEGYDMFTRQAISEAMLEIELTNILSGFYFDSDRHGNQERVQIKTGFSYHEHLFKLGLYDFGEIALTPPEEIELKQFANVLKVLPRTLFANQSFDDLLSQHMDLARIRNEPIRYLMRIRKGLLALQDFSNNLADEQLVMILNKIAHQGTAHPFLRPILQSCVDQITKLQRVSKFVSSVKQGFNIFKVKDVYSDPEDDPRLNHELSDVKPWATLKGNGRTH